MLHADEGDPLFRAALRGIGGRQIIRVQIAGDRRRADVKELFKMADLLLVVLERLDILQIADVLAWEDIVPF